LASVAITKRISQRSKYSSVWKFYSIIFSEYIEAEVNISLSSLETDKKFKSGSTAAVKKLVNSASAASITKVPASAAENVVKILVKLKFLIITVASC
jgi:hypothetical protein